MVALICRSRPMNGKATLITMRSRKENSQPIHRIARIVYLSFHLKPPVVLPLTETSSYDKKRPPQRHRVTEKT